MEYKNVNSSAMCSAVEEVMGGKVGTQQRLVVVGAYDCCCYYRRLVRGRGFGNRCDHLTVLFRASLLIAVLVA